jgi:4-hydroxyacetophenone monooxygenase
MTMSAIPANLEAILKEAHLPSLLMSLVHMTGDASLLSDEMTPVYDFFGDSKIGGYSPEIQERLRGQAAAALRAYLSGEKPLATRPTDSVILRMMNLVAGVEVPERYTPLLMEELGLDGIDQKRPVWDEATVQAGGKMKVLIIGAGMSGVCAGIRLKEAGIPFTIIEKNSAVGGSWYENFYPGCGVDTPNHFYSYSFSIWLPYLYTIFHSK